MHGANNTANLITKFEKWRIKADFFSIISDAFHQLQNFELFLMES